VNNASHQFRTSPYLTVLYLTVLQNITRSRSNVINYSNNDRMSMIPSQELTYNNIYNFDLDFDVLSNVYPILLMISLKIKTM
jgi:hypothetical protein